MKRTLLLVLLGLIVLKCEAALEDLLPLLNITIPDLSDICENRSFSGASVQCAEQLQVVCGNLSLFAKMLDASAKFPYAGLSYGTKWEYGNFDQCLSIDHTYEGGRVLGKHCATGLLIPDVSGNLTSSDSYYRMGTCRPDACSASDLNAVVGNVTGLSIPIFHDGMCDTSPITREFTNMDTFTAILMGGCGFLMVISTIYDFYLTKKQLKCKKPLRLAFSILSNGKKLLHVDRTSKEQIQTFNGMKVISMMWIIAGHGFVGIPNVSVSNAQDVEMWEETMYSGYIATAHLAVDTFFYISGFLLAYQYLKQKVKPVSVQVKTVPYLYLHRYLRLTPSLLILYLFTISLFRHTGSGPMWSTYTEIIMSTCRKYWWPYFLYIQNYYNYEDICMTTTWYISADMQMFLISPLIIIPVAWNLTKSSGFKTSMKELFVLNLFFIALPMTLKLAIPEYDNQYDTHSRLTNYFIGVMLGVFMRSQQDKPYLYMLKKREKIDSWNLFIWIFILLLMLAVVICYQDVQLHRGYVTNSVYVSLMRPAWCIGLSWIAYSCHHGYGGFVNWMLTRPIYQVIGRLTYSMYLVHGLVLIYFISTVRTRWYFNDYNAFYLFCGHYIVTLIISLFWTLAFESPVIIIEKVAFGGSGKKKETKIEDKPQTNGDIEEAVKTEDKPQTTAIYRNIEETVKSEDKPQTTAIYRNIEQTVKSEDKPQTTGIYRNIDEVVKTEDTLQNNENNGEAVMRDEDNEKIRYRN